MRKHDMFKSQVISFCRTKSKCNIFFIIFCGFTEGGHPKLFLFVHFPIFLLFGFPAAWLFPKLRTINNWRPQAIQASSARNKEKLGRIDVGQGGLCDLCFSYIAGWKTDALKQLSITHIMLLEGVQQLRPRPDWNTGVLKMIAATVANLDRW